MSKKKLIAITANTSWYLFNFRANLISTMLGEGYRVLAIAPLDDYSSRLSELGRDVTYQPIHIDQGGTNPLEDLRTAVGFLRIFLRERPAVILNFTPKNNIYATLAASRCKIPVINNIAGLGSAFIDEGAVTRVARWLYRISQPHAHHIFFQNKEDSELFLETGIASPKKMSRLPGSGVDLQRFKLTPLPGDSSIRFLLIARLLYEKGIEEYVMAAKAIKAKYPNVECRLVGFLDTKNPSAIPREVIQRWHSAGYINYRGATDNVEKEIAEAHCMVLPSYYREGVPRSLLEGAAMGRPIITTDNVGCRETVQDNINGFLCKPRDQASLTYAMESIATMETSARQAMASASRKFVETRFDEAIVLRRYVEETQGAVAIRQKYGLG